MRLSDWRASAPHREVLGPKVLGVLEPVLEALGAERDPHAWVAWGEDAAFRFSILVPTDIGLGVCVVRPNPGPEGARVSAKLVRWNRVQVGELDVETQQGHRLATVQIEGQVLKGVDAEADRMSRFGRAVIAAVDGRPMPSLDEPTRRARRTGTAAAMARPGATSPRPRAGGRKRPAASTTGS